MVEDLILELKYRKLNRKKVGIKTTTRNLKLRI